MCRTLQSKTTDFKTEWRERGRKGGQKGGWKMPCTSNDQGNANEIHNEVAPHTHKGKYSPEPRNQQVLANMWRGILELWYTVDQMMVCCAALTKTSVIVPTHKLNMKLPHDPNVAILDVPKRLESVPKKRFGHSCSQPPQLITTEGRRSTSIGDV